MHRYKLAAISLHKGDSPLSSQMQEQPNIKQNGQKIITGTSDPGWTYPAFCREEPSICAQGIHVCAGEVWWTLFCNGVK
jgi:hypothetical protein